MQGRRATNDLGSHLTEPARPRNGLVPGSEDWNIFWRQKILDLLDGKPDNGSRVPLEVFDEMLAEGDAPYGAC